MGTRAAFWIGDPRTENREWLGCVAWDGYPGGDCRNLFEATTEQEFRERIAAMRASRKDFATPDKGWPFPWSDDVFLTDFTYAWIDGNPVASCFHHGFSGKECLEDGFEWPEEDDPTLCNIWI